MEFGKWIIVNRKNMKMIIKLMFVLLILLLNYGCGNAVPEFSGERAFQYLEKQCAFGPRNPGSKGYENCLAYLIEELQSTADTVWTQPFTYKDPFRGGNYDLQNIIGRFNPTSEKQILLGAHWDTRPWSDMEVDEQKQNNPILGANDGASGVAVLLELAKVLNENPSSTGITIILFDGEDLGFSGENKSYAQGSQYFAQNLPIPKPDHAIILDMVGDKYPHFPIERFSYRNAPRLVRSLWKLAQKLNLPAFDQTLGYTLYDDHVPLWDYAQIPSVDIIDFDYPHEYENYWHTNEDTPDNCSAKSLDQVGTLLIHHIYGIE